jgi:hypothetical protein
VNEDGAIISLRESAPWFMDHIDILTEAVDVYDENEFGDVRQLDVADLGLQFGSKEDILLYYSIISRIFSRFDAPLIAMFALDSGYEDIQKDLVLARETQRCGEADVVLFNVEDPIRIWEEAGGDISYVVGIGATKYHTRNILENAHRGPLLNSDQMFKSLTGGKKK